MSCRRTPGTPKPPKGFFRRSFMAHFASPADLPNFSTWQKAFGMQRVYPRSQPEGVPHTSGRLRQSNGQNGLLQLLSNSFPAFLWDIFSGTKVSVLTQGKNPHLHWGCAKPRASVGLWTQALKKKKFSSLRGV